MLAPVISSLDGICCTLKGTKLGTMAADFRYRPRSSETETETERSETEIERSKTETERSETEKDTWKEQSEGQ